MNYDLSVIVAGIRIDKWNDLYASIEQSTKRSFEVIFVGPEFPPLELQNCPNVMFIRDFGSPTRCRQIGLQFATGTYTTWQGDDAPFLPGAIDGMFDILSKMPRASERNIVSGKYYEGRQYAGTDEIHESNQYYTLGFHDPIRTKHNPDSWFLVNMGIINTNYLKFLGGWDCNFEVNALADADLAVRAQRNGAKVELTPFCIATAEWSPGTSGDHGPVHHAIVDHDAALFLEIYNNPNCSKRIHVPIDNWLSSPSYWPRRFPDKIQPVVSKAAAPIIDSVQDDDYELSIIVPGIRTSAWKALYDSTVASTTRSFEMIFVGPHGLPDELKGMENIRHIEDMGHPTRCMQIGLINSKGKYIIWGSDDCMFLPSAIDKTFDVYNSLGNVEKKAVAAKYLEGDSPADAKIHMDPAYYVIRKHPSLKSKFIPKSYIFFAPGLIARDYLTSLGGWDCRFEGLAMSCLDLSIRVQRDNALFALTEFAISHCTWCADGQAGDHGPVHDCQVQNDHPLYLQIYRSSSGCLERIKIPLDNWKDQESVWGRRFSK